MTVREEVVPAGGRIVNRKEKKRKKKRGRSIDASVEIDDDIDGRDEDLGGDEHDD